MDVFQNIMLVFMAIVMLGMLIALSIVTEKLMYFIEEVHQKIFELEENKNLDGTILDDNFAFEEANNDENCGNEIPISRE